MSTPPRVYLDNAATSWPKPESVYRAVDQFQRDIGASAGRGAYREGMESNRLVAAARASVARLIGAGDPRQVVFTNSGTDSLNAALHGSLREADHVITTAAEHNSVLRPLQELAARRKIEVTHVPCDALGRVDPDDVRQALRSGTRLVAMQHASNVTGVMQPVAEVSRIAREHGAMLLVDAAQTAGHLPVDVEELGADLLAAPGHKGLLGPLGTGILWIRRELAASLHSLRQGGTGSRSQEDRQPDMLPDKYEAGSLNMPGLAGLAAGLEHLERHTIGAIAAHESRLAGQLLAGLREMPGVTLYGVDGIARRVGVVSVNVAGYDSQELAALLDSTFGIKVRAGLHCAPRMHEALGTLAGGGTVRFSVGAMTTAADIAAALAAIAAIAPLSPSRAVGKESTAGQKSTRTP